MSTKLIKTNTEISQALTQAAPDVDAFLRSCDAPIIVGIATGGMWLARHLFEHQLKTHPNLEYGVLNIGLYRDDFHHRGLAQAASSTVLPHSLEGRNILLVDDVLHSGRTIRAAMNALFDRGRPASIKLWVLVNRGDRQLPIQPDYSLFEITPDTDARLELSGPEELQLWQVKTKK